MLKNVDRMGVLVLLSHLIITALLIIGYILLVIMDKDVSTLSMLLIAVVSYWFGAIGNNAIRPNASTNINQANEVKVNPPQPPDQNSQG